MMGLGCDVVPCPCSSEGDTMEGAERRSGGVYVDAGAVIHNLRLGHTSSWSSGPILPGSPRDFSSLP